MQRFIDLVGGSISTIGRPNRKIMYHAVIKGHSHVKAVLKIVLPYLVIKMGKAIEVVEFIESRKWGERSLEGRRNISESIMKSWNNPQIRESRIRGIKLANNKELRNHRSDVMRKLWLNSVMREKWIKSMKGRTSEQRERMREATRRNWLDPDIRAKRIVGMMHCKGMKKIVL